MRNLVLVHNEAITPVRGEWLETTTMDGCFLIPGRATQYKGATWTRWRDIVRSCAPTTPLAGFINISALAYYGYNPELKLTHDTVADRLHIPSTFIIAEALGVALLGSLYERRAQVQRLEVVRLIVPEDQLQAELGRDYRRGAVRICYDSA